MMDEKQKLLKLKAEIGAAEQNLINALNHLRDFRKIQIDQDIADELKQILKSLPMKLAEMKQGHLQLLRTRLEDVIVTFGGKLEV